MIGHTVLAYQMWFKHVLPSSGFNPRWDCTFKFQLHVPELVLVRFMVEDHDYATSNDFLGQFTFPFTSMRTGMTFIDSLLNTNCPVLAAHTYSVTFVLQVTDMCICWKQTALACLPPVSSSMLKSLLATAALPDKRAHIVPENKACS